MKTTTCSPRSTTLVAQACANVQGFNDLFKRLKRRMKTSGRSDSTLHNYTLHLAKMDIRFNAQSLDVSYSQALVLQEKNKKPR